MGGVSRVLRVSLGAVLFTGFIWFLFIGVLTSQPTKRSTVTIPSNANLKLLKAMEAERRAVRSKLDFNYVSKRRVPSGPDPIHNRRARVAREPPTRA